MFGIYNHLAVSNSLMLNARQKCKRIGRHNKTPNAIASAATYSI